MANLSKTYVKSMFNDAKLRILSDSDSLKSEFINIKLCENSINMSLNIKRKNIMNDAWVNKFINKLTKRANKPAAIYKNNMIIDFNVRLLKLKFALENTTHIKHISIGLIDCNSHVSDFKEIDTIIFITWLNDMIELIDNRGIKYLTKQNKRIIKHMSKIKIINTINKSRDMSITIKVPY